LFRAGIEAAYRDRRRRWHRRADREVV